MSHRAAAYLWGLERSAPSILWVSIPHSRTVVRPVGTRITRRRRWESTTRRGLRVTTVAQTIVDLTAQPGCTLDEAVALLGRAAQQDLLDPSALQAALKGARQHPIRGETLLLYQDIERGVESALELRVVRDVLVAHGLSGFDL